MQPLFVLHFHLLVKLPVVDPKGRLGPSAQFTPRDASCRLDKGQLRFLDLRQEK